MTISIKDSLKFVGIIVSACCAVLVCNMFLNYDIDLRMIGDSVEEAQKELYKVLRLNNVVVCAVSGGCLVLTSVVMLIFYIGNYIEANSAKFGILKALGYSNLQIALKCAVFGVCVFIGAVVGYALSWAIMPAFYRVNNNPENNLPEIVLRFHVQLPFLLVILPSALFAALSVAIALFKLRLPALSLIRGEVRRERKTKIRKKDGDKPFLRELALSVINQKKSLAFFIAFGTFCFSSMMQMGMSMNDYAGDMMGIMILVIGIVLAAVSLYMAMSSVIGGNKKTLAMLKVTGYSLKERASAVLGPYHMPAVIGFAVGSAYQYGILYIMVNMVFAGFDNVTVYSFDWAMFGICFAVFVVAYEAINLIYTVLIGRTSVKSVMSE